MWILWQIIFSYRTIEGTQSQFMKATKIINVSFVVNHILKEEIWRSTFTDFMKAKKIKNVIHYLWQIIFLKYELWRDTLILFLLKSANIMNVNFGAMGPLWEYFPPGSIWRKAADQQNAMNAQLHTIFILPTI